MTRVPYYARYARIRSTAVRSQRSFRISAADIGSVYTKTSAMKAAAELPTITYLFLSVKRRAAHR